jgi:hypothetical protein
MESNTALKAERLLMRARAATPITPHIGRFSISSRSSVHARPRAKEPSGLKGARCASPASASRLARPSPARPAPAMRLWSCRRPRSTTRNLLPSDRWATRKGGSPHQFRTRNNLTKTQRTRSNADGTAVKSTKLIDILPLITAWLQVERFPNRQLNQLCFGSNHCPHRCEVHQAFGMPIGPRTARRFTGARQARGKRGAIRPVCTPRLPSSHTCALDFFLAGEDYDLIASDRSWFEAEAWAARTKRLGSRH